MHDNDIPIAALLARASDAQVGALGEETAAGLLTAEFDATIVALGDAGLERIGGLQHLDILAIVDGEAVAFEVKTRYRSRLAGRLTRTGNLRRPRLRRATSGGEQRQGSQGYVAARLADWIDTGEGYDGIDVRVMAVDFVAMLAQQFSVDNDGGRLQPLGPPVTCITAASDALATIVAHRGHL